MKSRAWLKDLLVAESDSESEGELNFSAKDLQALLKVGVVDKTIKLLPNGFRFIESAGIYKKFIIKMRQIVR